MRSILKDKSGKAREGLKSGVGQYLIRSIEMQGVTDELGQSYLNGLKLKRMIDDPETAKAIRQVYSDPEFARLKHMSDILSKFQRQRMRGSREKIQALQDAPAWLLDKVAGISGAMVGRKIGRATGASTIQTPGIVAGAARDMLRRLTADKAAQMLSDAIENKELFDALLNYRPTSKPNSKPAQKLRAWMAGPGARLFEDEEEGRD